MIQKYDELIHDPVKYVICRLCKE